MTRRFSLPRIAMALTAASGVVLGYVGWRWVRPRREPPPPDPGEVTPQEVYFPSLDSTRLHAAYIEGRANYPTLVLCHGYFKSLAEPWEVGLRLNQAGYNVFLIDFRASGQSGGRFTTIGYKETWDVLAAVRFVRERYRRGPIGVLGISMGASAAIMAAAQSPDIAAVVADSAYSHLEGVMGKKIPDFVPFRWLVPLGWLSIRIGEWLSGGRVRVVRPVDYVDRIAPRPLLLIYGEQDSYIPPEQPHELYGRAGEPKEIWLAPGSDHAVARLDHPEEYLKRVQGWFDRHLLGVKRRAPGRRALNPRKGRR